MGKARRHCSKYMHTLGSQNIKIFYAIKKKERQYLGGTRVASDI